MLSLLVDSWKGRCPTRPPITWAVCFHLHHLEWSRNMNMKSALVEDSPNEQQPPSLYPSHPQPSLWKQHTAAKVKRSGTRKGGLESSSTEGKYLYHNSAMIHPVAPVLGSRCGRRLSDGQSEGQQQPGDLASRNALAVLFQSQVVPMANLAPVPVAAEIRNLQVIQNFVGASNCQQRSPSSPSDETYSNAHVPKRSRSDFSIEAILARNPPLAITIPQQSSKESIIQIDSNPVSAKHIQSETSPSHQLSWVHCTRYRPPKLPRKLKL
jgi:hypothetical protein